jgi:redox-sensitive bicupin YhaK (pirin superfamily)
MIEVTSSRIRDVGGSSVLRALPVHGHRTVGAWCFLDHFDGRVGMNIGPHPHMGLQTVTWLFEGELLHTDSLGSEQRIRPGQLNLMSAGNGVAHAEDGRDATDTGRGVQLWVAQPEATRHGPAAFEHHAELPQVRVGDSDATILVGSFAGATSAARTDTPLVGVDLILRGTTELTLDPTFEHAVVVVEGALTIDDTAVSADQFGYLPVGTERAALATDTGARALLLGGTPFESDIYMWWNFVGRDRVEMVAAYRDWQAGGDRFGEVKTDLARIPAPRPEWMTSD